MDESVSLTSLYPSAMSLEVESLPPAGAEANSSYDEATDEGTEGDSSEEDEEEYEEDFDEDFKRQCKEMMRGLLLEIYQEEHVDRNLEYFLTGEGHETYYRQPDLSTPEIQEKEEQVLMAANQLHEFYLQSRNLYKSCYLFLNAPCSSRSRHMEEDRQANEVQNKKFYTNLIKTESEALRNPRAEMVVRTKPDIHLAIRKLFMEMSMQTKRITIVFNGEGYEGDRVYPKGSLCLHNDNPMPMEEFTDYILSTWSEVVDTLAAKYSTSQAAPQKPGTKTIVPMEVEDEYVESVTASDAGKPPPGYREEVDILPAIPSTVSVIFGQCYSHNYSCKPSLASKWQSQFEVIKLTDPNVNDGKAQCTYKFHKPSKLPGIIRHLLDSDHLELNHFAKMNADIKKTLDPNNEYQALFGAVPV